eukprot:CAMPEP_0181249098 /NCGR_PEP_ID=MMETSP1096-20121128/45558_1 /TAXON_ID=156174 ORGANISM="Chrysochromulina ericina, Strain CCMP281" /NCGR_SAMPLE_ID=MMETSP1096 /ASSEMBLY_ACC=CAM_ASM_000453 /LENGTH=118 /DNA_ID=CAMNT_0023346383 /DNA_START=244 /DNA_END=598 /DNA_ORIENTATION=-
MRYVSTHRTIGQPLFSALAVRKLPRATAIPVYPLFDPSRGRMSSTREALRAAGAMYGSASPYSPAADTRAGIRDPADTRRGSGIIRDESRARLADCSGVWAAQGLLRPHEERPSGEHL